MGHFKMNTLRSVCGDPLVSLALGKDHFLFRLDKIIDREEFTLALVSNQSGPALLHTLFDIPNNILRRSQLLVRCCNLALTKWRESSPSPACDGEPHTEMISPVSACGLHLIGPQIGYGIRR